MSPKSVKVNFQVLQQQWEECLSISGAHVFQASLLLFILLPVLSLSINSSFHSSAFAA